MIKCKKILKLSLKGFFFHQGNEHFPFVIQTKRSQLRLTLMIGHQEISLQLKREIIVTKNEIPV